MAVRFITTYCRKNGGEPISKQKVENIPPEDNFENQVIDMWLQEFLANKE